MDILVKRILEKYGKVHVDAFLRRKARILKEDMKALLLKGLK